MARHSVTTQIAFCYGHRIVGHAGPCRHLHGHNAVAEVVCEGPLDALGMVADFGEVKRALHAFVDASWDHRTILRRDDPLAAVLREAGEPVYLLDGEPTAENLAAVLFRVAREAGFPVRSVRFYETPTSHAAYEER
jgi:6-pyruvoyltetrahydropterin/6-carboxytetrahydropterin synthase